jgi:DNA-binding LytR/AlgR family response regulator
MNVLIIEDEKLAADHISSLVKLYDPEINILARLDSVKKSVQWFNVNLKPDLVFMDIQLADGLSFEIFEQAIVDCPIIFTTAFNEYALKAFKVNSIDYLLKPIDFDELNVAIDKYKEVQGVVVQSQYQLVMDNVLNMLSDNYKQRFVIKVGEHIKSIAVEDILYFYSMEKATFLHTANDHNYVIDYSVDQLENLLDPKKFFRINRKYLIGMGSIDDIISYSNSRLKIELKHSSDMDAIVAREKVNKFKKWLDR